MRNKRNILEQSLKIGRMTFTKKAEKRGMDVKEFASKVTANPDEYDTRTVRQANLAKTLSKLRKRKKKYLCQYSITN